MAVDGETVKIVTDFIFGGSKITADGDCSHEIKRCLLLGRKVMTSLAAAAKSLQSCLTLCDPMDCSLPGSPVPGILQARTLEWVAISFSNGWKWKGKVTLLSRVQLFTTPWTAAYQAPPSLGFSRQEYWSGLPLSSPVTNLDGILKSRDVTLLTKIHLVKVMIFPVVMYRCASWIIKKAECQRIDAFELWCWRSLLRVPWTARRSSQSILKEISPECSLEGLMLQLKLLILWLPDVKNWLIRKDPDARKDWRQEEKGTTENEMVGWHHWLDDHEFE